MSKVFAVMVETAPGYSAYALSHPDHNQRQRAWFVQMANEGKLLACGPYVPGEGTGLWLLRAGNHEEAIAITRTSPRFKDGMLAEEKTRIVEWTVSIGKERFA